ncbi:polyamine oxidase 4 [Phlyctema vagabunda]|uniref:Polyamine oxidase 4 n=1 Tax=Phlyctema vagabunda TaxID=108571 RepID=A0ABR4PUT2_9HELO
MDSHSVSYTTPSRRGSSRAYKDLLSCGVYAHYSTVQAADFWDKSNQFLKMSKSRLFSSSKTPHIGIVGAGVSGLRCADVLLQNGFKVSLLEARDRVGGRLYQTTLPTGQVVDLGPNWIHGTDNNPMLDLAKITNTETHTWPANSNLFADDGTLIPSDEATHLGDKMWEIIFEAFKYSNANTADISVDESLYDFFSKRVVELYPGSEHDEKRKTLLQMAEMWGAFVGSPVHRQSLKFFWLEECLEGETLFCAGTYQKILALIAKRALERAEIKFLTKVTKITTSEEKRVTLSTNNGSQLEFDEVVMTAPLGWLKQNQDTFQPPLSRSLVKAIDSIGYGCLEKVYISFPRAFWLKKDIPKADQPVAGFVQWISPQYTAVTNPNRWNQEVVEMATLSGDCARPTLLFYIYGEQSRSLAKELASLPSPKAQEEHVTKFFEPYYSLLPNYNSASEDCVPVSTLATKWVLDDLAGNGSYCNFQIGVEEADKDIEVMREGLPDRSLWFAGEHTSPFVALGTVTGAYWSGEAVGKRIAQAWGRNVEVEKIGEEVPGASVHEEEVNLHGLKDAVLPK